MTIRNQDNFWKEQGAQIALTAAMGLGAIIVARVLRNRLKESRQAQALVVIAVSDD